MAFFGYQKLMDASSCEKLATTVLKMDFNSAIVTMSTT